MGKFVDLTGSIFGALRVLSIGPRSARGGITWRCVCSCGQEKVALTGYLKSGQTTSCGCLVAAKRDAHKTTHGHRDSITYSSWCAMRTRCTNPNVASFKSYGGRGIKVCQRWDSFENFLADMGERPSLEYSIERERTDGDYEPGNCRWDTRLAQSNNKRSNVRLQHDGLHLTLAQWSRRTGIDMKTLSNRVLLGWTPAEVLTLEPRYGLKRHPQPHRADGTFAKRGEAL